MKKLIFLLFFPSICFGAGTVSINQGGGSGTVTIAGGSGGGGGAGTITGVTAGAGLAGGGMTGNVTLSLSPSSTMYIQNQSAVVQQSTFSVLVGTIATNLTIGNGGAGSSANINGSILIDRPDLGSGFGSGRSAFSFNPGSGQPVLNVQSYDTSSSGKNSLITFNNSVGTTVGYLNFPIIPDNSTAYQINMTTDITSPQTFARFKIFSTNGKIQFYDTKGSSAFVEFDPIGNSSFTLPVALSTITASKNMVASYLSPGVLHLQAGTSNFATMLVSLSTETTGILPNASIDGSSITKAGLLVAGTNVTIAYGIGVATISSSGSGGGVSVYPATGTIIATTAGINASTITVSSLTVTAQLLGTFNLVFDAAQSKLPGASSPYISNSTNETSASIYFDDTSTQSVTWTGLVQNYDGRALFADIIFTSTATSGTINWGVYTDTEAPNIGLDNYDSPVFSVVVTTSVTSNSVSNSLQKATVALSNTITANGQLVTFKLEREAGSAGDTAVGFGRVKKLRIYE